MRQLDHVLIVVLLIFATTGLANNKPTDDLNGLYQIVEIKPGLVEVKMSHTGDLTYKNTAEAMENTLLREVPEMVIDVEVIDFEYYADRYVHWQDVHIWNPYEVPVADTDQDDNLEIVGIRNYPPMSIPPGESWLYDKMYELQDGIFTHVFDFPDSTTIPHWAGDLDNDGNQEFLLAYYYLNTDSNAYGKVFQNYEVTPPNLDTPELNFVFNQPLLSQANHPTIIDLDQDGEMEMIYYLDGGHHTGATCPNEINIAEYNPSINNFENKYCFVTPAFYTSHFAVDDWDMDGHLEFATGGLDGEMYIVENTGDDTYECIFEDTLDTYNAYMSTSTNDMNGNGKPELWIGGDRSSSGTTIFCFESSGNNEYENVFKIRLPGVFSFYDYGVVDTDIDLDGIDELMIWASGKIFILKNSGPESYEIIYAHRNDEWDEPLYQLYFSATSKDVSGDGYPELLVSMSNWLGDDQFFFTEIYQPTGSLLDIESGFQEIPFSQNLLRAYPNPFNGSITIRWPYIDSDDVSLHIFDMKGRLVNSVTISINSNCKESEFRWNATDSSGKEVVSGIYIINISSPKSQLFTKVVFLE